MRLDQICVSPRQNKQPTRKGISLIGQSPAAAGLRRMVALAAATDAPLMLKGPDGGGKQDIAAMIHERSDRAAAGFISVHPASIDTGFLSERPFDSAIGGSVYFDEIGDIPAVMQNQLYSLLQNRNTRIITATSKSTSELSKENRLPVELCAALSVLILPVPALSERKQDIELLTEAYLQQLPKESRFTLDHGANEILRAHNWPGNLDELQDQVRQLAKHHHGRRVSQQDMIAILRKKGITPKGYTESRKMTASDMLTPGFDLQHHLAQQEAEYIEAALEKANGVVQRAADLTSTKRTTFLAKMKRHGIERTAASPGDL